MSAFNNEYEYGCLKSFKDIRDWKGFYDSDILVIKTDSTEKQQESYYSERQMIPKLIVDTWKTRLLSELPSVEENSKNLLPYVKQYLDTITFNMLAYGTFFTVPIKINDSWMLRVVNNYNVSSLSFVEVNGMIQKLQYEQIEKVLINNKPYSAMAKYTYVFENGEQKLYKTTKTELGKITEDLFLAKQPVVMRHQLDFQADGVGYPIYARACTLIQGVDKTFAQMNIEEELNKTEVAVPKGKLNMNGIRDMDKVARIPHARKYVVIPGDETMENIYSGGKFNPQPYIDAINYKLHMISLLVGFGNKYLSYDDTANGVTTAKGIGFSQNTLYASKEKLQQTLSTMIEKVVYSLLACENGTTSFPTYNDFSLNETLTIRWQDNVFVTEDEKRTDLFKAYEMGLISKEYCLKEAYNLTEEEVKEALTGTMIDGA